MRAGILRVAWLRWMRCLNACATTSRGPPSLSGSPEVVAHALKQRSVGIPSQRKVHGARTCDCACAGGNYPDELGDLLREFMLEHSKLLGSLVAENERLRKKLADCTEDRERLVDQVLEAEGRSQGGLAVSDCGHSRVCLLSLP